MGIHETELLISVQLLKSTSPFSFWVVWVPAMSSKKCFRAKSLTFVNAIRPDTLLFSFTWRRRAREPHQEAIYSSIIRCAPGWDFAKHSCSVPRHLLFLSPGCTGGVLGQLCAAKRALCTWSSLVRWEQVPGLSCANHSKGGPYEASVSDEVERRSNRIGKESSRRRLLVDVALTNSAHKTINPCTLPWHYYKYEASILRMGPLLRLTCENRAFTPC